MNGQRADSEFDSDLDANRTMLLPKLAHALWVWDVAALELGEVAVVTSGSEDVALYCLVASWRTGRTPLFIQVGSDAVPSRDAAITLDMSDPQRTVEMLAEFLSSAPGTVATLLSSDAGVLDVLMNAMPKWGRIVLAGQRFEPAAIDFYNHVHRKGVRILSVAPVAERVFDSGLRTHASQHFERARLILTHDRLAERCLRAVELT